MMKYMVNNTKQCAHTNALHPPPVKINLLSRHVDIIFLNVVIGYKFLSSCQYTLDADKRLQTVLSSPNSYVAVLCLINWCEINENGCSCVSVAG